MNEKKRKMLLLLLVIFFAALLRTTALEKREFAVDEGFTIPFIHKGWGEMLELFNTTEAHPPLYPFFAKTVLLLFGSVFFVRLASAVFGVAAVILSFALAKKFFDERTAIIAATLVAFNPLCVFYSQQARSYSMLLFLFLLLALMIERFAREPTSKKLAVEIGILNAIILYTHYNSAVIMLAETCIFAFLWKRKKIRFAQGLLPLAIGAILFLPWVPVLAKQAGFVDAGQYGGTPADFVYIFYKFAVGANFSFLMDGHIELIAALPLASALVLAGVFLALKEKKSLFVLCLGLPLALSAVVALAVPMMLHFRHVSYILPLYLMAAAFAISKIKNRIASAALLALVLLCWIGILALYYGIVSMPDWNVMIGL